MFSIIKEGRPEGRPSNFGSSRALTRLGFRHRAIRSTLHEAELAGILEFGLRNLPIIVGVGQLEVGDVGSCLVGRQGIAATGSLTPKTLALTIIQDCTRTARGTRTC